MKPQARRPRPSLELVGDWTGPRLLIRLMQVIRSPWDLTERGLRSRNNGEICRIEMRGPDPALLPRFREGDSPVAPTLTPEILEAIDGHKSVLRIQADPSLEGEAALAAVARCGGALVNAGAIAVWCPQSGAAHAADRWLELAELLEDEDDEDDEEDENTEDLDEDMDDIPDEDEEDLDEEDLDDLDDGFADGFADGLVGLEPEDLFFTLYVRGLVQGADRWTTAGMGLLGLPDVAVPVELPDAIALSILSRMTDALRRGQPPAEGETARPSVRLPPGRWTHQPDPRPAREPMSNPFGVWRLLVP